VTLKVKSYLYHDIHRIMLGYIEMIVMRSNMQGEDILEHANAKFHLCNMDILHFMTLLNTLMSR
jgi:hypothetical protein